MAKAAHSCAKVSEKDVWALDVHGNKVVLGAIVELKEWPTDRYRGLFYVVGFEQISGKPTRVWLANTRWENGVIRAGGARLMLRCNVPVREKGE